VCYTGTYTPYHPKIPPGIVYGLANGVVDNLPVVLYHPEQIQLHTHGSLHYCLVCGFLFFGVSIFKYLFLADHLKKHDDDDDDQNNKLITIDYSKKYYDKYDELCKQKDVSKIKEKCDNNSDSITKEKSMPLNQVIDFTGQYGNVMMYYNPVSESFDYFADNKNVPFTYLETVSRRLGNIFHCTDKIIDRRTIVNDDDNKNNDNNKRKHNDTRKLSNIVKAKANKFIYVGKFSSINPLQTLQYEEASSSKKSIRSKLSYKEYMESLKRT